MAIQRLRPGPWKLVYSATSAAIEIQIDYEKFSIPPAIAGTRDSVEFEIQHMGLYDDANIVAYRNPVKTVVSVGSTGGTTEPISPPMKSPYFKARKY
jgi:hypothetical protein